MTDLHVSADFAVPFTIAWQPKADISTHELALCLPILIGGMTYPVWWTRQRYEALPVSAQRHFGTPVQQQQQSEEIAATAPQSIWDSLKSVASA